MWVTFFLLVEFLPINYSETSLNFITTLMIHSSLGHGTLCMCRMISHLRTRISSMMVITFFSMLRDWPTLGRLLRKVGGLDLSMIWLWNFLRADATIPLRKFKRHEKLVADGHTNKKALRSNIFMKINLDFWNDLYSLLRRKIFRKILDNTMSTPPWVISLNYYCS